MIFIDKLCFIILFILVILINCSKKWPNGRIPYILDQKLRTNHVQRYSLFNTLIDLNKRTCLKFIPKKEENSNFVEFRYYTRSPSCWNFLTYTNGTNVVSGGLSCLSPKDSLHKHNFTDCDIQYINLFYKCPKFIPKLLDCNSSYTIPIDKTIKNDYKFNNKKQNWQGNSRVLKKYSIKNKDNFLNITIEDIKKLFKMFKKTTALPINSFVTKKFQSSTIKPTTISTYPTTITTHFLETTTSSITTTRQVKTLNNTCEINCNFKIYLKRLFILHNGNFNVRDTLLESDTSSLKHFQTDNYIIQSGDTFIASIENNDICSCTVPLYRLFNSIISDHFYTTNETELRSARTINGYKFEKIEGYCSQDAGCGALLPLYRFWNPLISDHLYTTDEKEMIFYKTNLIHGYIFEKIECYLWNRQNLLKYCSK